MQSVVFSFGSDLAAREADLKLRQSGIPSYRVHVIDRFCYLPPAANDDGVEAPALSLPEELDREVAEGRVLIEVDLGEDEYEEIEELMCSAGARIRRFFTTRGVR